MWVQVHLALFDLWVELSDSDIWFLAGSGTWHWKCRFTLHWAEFSLLTWPFVFNFVAEISTGTCECKFTLHFLLFHLALSLVLASSDLVFLPRWSWKSAVGGECKFTLHFLKFEWFWLWCFGRYRYVTVKVQVHLALFAHTARILTTNFLLQVVSDYSSACTEVWITSSPFYLLTWGHFSFFVFWNVNRYWWVQLHFRPNFAGSCVTDMHFPWFGKNVITYTFGLIIQVLCK